jgi:hypothetical protein
VLSTKREPFLCSLCMVCMLVTARGAHRVERYMAAAARAQQGLEPDSDEVRQLLGAVIIDQRLT